MNAASGQEVANHMTNINRDEKVQLQKGFVIAGPTASGKSALALEIASTATSPLIINADSRQVYKQLPILTAQPSKQDLIKVNHALYGYVNVDEQYGVMRWLYDLRQILLNNPNSTPIIVGGTGLYMQSLLEGIADLPPANYNAYNNYNLEECQNKLQQIDPKYAQIAKDRRRIVRALDLYDQTGQLMSQLKRKKILDIQVTKIYIDKVDLKERINKRLCEDIYNMIEEVKLAKDQLQGTRLGSSIGVDCILGNQNKEEILKQMSHKTWQYAKRQRVWFKKYYQSDKIMI